KALQKLHRKRCDLIVVNDPTAINGTKTNVEILNSDGDSIAKVSGDKLAVARRLFKEIRGYLTEKEARRENSRRP
ncbi:MAG: hypothetical protein IIU43_02700, partial [Thermoguttaceae bacterium]|nr:hypothetical protein [Thermoguttaceae bacterium]